MLVLEVNSFAPEHLHGHVYVVDFLQATDGRQAQLGRQTPVLGEELHHPPARKTHIKSNIWFWAILGVLWKRSL